MFKDFFKNPVTILHAVGITMTISAWTVIELYLHCLPRERLDSRLRLWARSLLSYINLKYTVYNPHQIEIEPGKAYIIMCNHCSYYDIPLSLMAMNGSIRMMAKKELLQIPVWGRAMKLTEFVSIDRANPRQALKDMKYARRMMEKGIILWIAPEGTRSKTGSLQKLKPGGFRLAIDSGATIIPLAIIGSGEVMAAKSLQVTRGKSVDIHIGKTIDAATYTKRQRENLMKVFEAEIRGIMTNPSSGLKEMNQPGE